MVFIESRSAVAVSATVNKAVTQEGTGRVALAPEDSVLSRETVGAGWSGSPRSND